MDDWAREPSPELLHSLIVSEITAATIYGRALGPQVEEKKTTFFLEIVF